MTKEFQVLLLEQLPRMRVFVLSMTRNPADADDLLQVAAERMLKYESYFEVGSNFPAWSYRILKNSHISNCRAHKRRPVSINHFAEAAAPPPSLVSSARQEDHVYAREVVLAMDKLSPPSREILTLVCGAQLGYEEVAAMLACSVGTVKSRLNRARSQMKSLLFNIAPRELSVSPTPRRAAVSPSEPRATTP